MLYGRWTIEDGRGPLVHIRDNKIAEALLASKNQEDEANA